VNTSLQNGGLVVSLDAPLRCLSSAVLGGGLGWIRTWLNLQVDSSYDCRDPESDLRRASAGLEQPVVGMLTATKVDRFTRTSVGLAQAITTVGLRRPIAAASPIKHPLHPAGTINLFVIVGASLTDGGLVNALQTAVEAKTQALASARVAALNFDGFATGTATDSVCVACPPGQTVQFSGPATPHGLDVAQAVYGAVLEGTVAYGARADRVAD
jgi:adenosylcobinamide hydrolase